MQKRVKAFFRSFRVHRTLWLMMIPAIVYFLVFSYLPMAGAYFAFTKRVRNSHYKPKNRVKNAQKST